MRTTVRIDDDLLRSLKEQAHRDGVSLAKLINGALRRGLHARGEKNRRVKPYREKTFDMGLPKFNLDKALAFADLLEDEEILKKLARGK
ncbi:MAG: CopG family transcriptional regulator [Thermoguttaceae bacterium]|jgi:hypothetical protein